jgi:kynurenine formamidase
VSALDGPRAAPFGFTRIVFLSHVITAGSPTFPGDPPVEIRPAATIERDGYHLQSLVAGEHAGTHWAAPAHFAEDQAGADELDPGDFFYPAVVLDVRAGVKEDPDFALSVAEIRAGRRNSGRSRRTAPSSCGRASRTAGTTRRPT